MNYSPDISEMAGASAAIEEQRAGGQNISNLERIISAGLGSMLFFNGLRKLGRSPVSSLSKAIAGGGLIIRGVTGYCPMYQYLGVDGAKTTSVNIRTHLIVNKPREEVYALWRKLDNLPLFMSHLSSVEETGHNISRWEAKFPENSPVSIKWEAEIVRDEPGVLLSWRSLPGFSIQNAGKIEFKDALGSKGVDLKIMITYRPPAGNIGHGVSWLLNPLFRKAIEKDLVNFKQFAEMKGTSSAGKFAK